MKIVYIFCITLFLILFETIGQVTTKGITKHTNMESSFLYGSPDGRMIVFQSNRNDIYNTDIYTVTSDVENLMRLTSAPPYSSL